MRLILLFGNVYPHHISRRVAQETAYWSHDISLDMLAVSNTCPATIPSRLGMLYYSRCSLRFRRWGSARSHTNGRTGAWIDVSWEGGSKATGQRLGPPISALGAL